MRWRKKKKEVGYITILLNSFMLLTLYRWYVADVLEVTQSASRLLIDYLHCKESVKLHAGVQDSAGRTHGPVPNSKYCGIR